MDFSQRLKELRKSYNLTQTFLASELDLTERQYQRLETNNSRPNFDNLIALADYFDVPLDYLTGRGIFANWEQVLECWDLIISEVGKLSLPDLKISNFADFIKCYSDSVNGDKIKIGMLLSSLISKLEFNTDEDGKIEVSFYWKF